MSTSESSAALIIVLSYNLEHERALGNRLQESWQEIWQGEGMSSGQADEE